MSEHTAEKDAIYEARTPRGVGAAVVGLTPSPDFQPPTFCLDGPPPAETEVVEIADLRAEWKDADAERRAAIEAEVAALTSDGAA